MKQFKNVLIQQNDIDLQGSAMLIQFDWANSIGEEYRHFGASHPTPECLISYNQISERSSKVELEQERNLNRSEHYRIKTICTQLWDRCKNTLIRLQRIPIAFV